MWHLNGIKFHLVIEVWYNVWKQHAVSYFQRIMTFKVNDKDNKAKFSVSLVTEHAPVIVMALEYSP